MRRVECHSILALTPVKIKRKLWATRMRIGYFEQAARASVTAAPAATDEADSENDPLPARKEAKAAGGTVWARRFRVHEQVDSEADLAPVHQSRNCCCWAGG